MPPASNADQSGSREDSGAAGGGELVCSYEVESGQQISSERTQKDDSEQYIKDHGIDDNFQTRKIMEVVQRVQPLFPGNGMQYFHKTQLCIPEILDD